jgi:hypothetical protein
MATSANSHVVDFREDIHELSVGGRVLPSVTTVLSAVGLLGNAEQWFTEDAAFRGSVVHQICEYDDRGDLAEDEPIVQQHMGYLVAHRKFKSDSGFVAEEIERPMADPALGFAGIMDRSGMSGSWPAVVDLKSGAVGKWVGLQLAAYVHLARVNGIHGNIPFAQWKRYAVRLQADGKYSVKVFDALTDWKVFASALAVYNWRNQ